MRLTYKDMEVENLVMDEAKQKTLYEDRIARCVPVAKKVLDILHAHLPELELGDSQTSAKSISPVAASVLALFLEENIHWCDKDFILQLALQPAVSLNEVLGTSFGISWDKAVGKAFGGKDSLDLTFKDVDEMLKS